MQKSEFLKRLLDERRSTWGMVDTGANVIDYPAGQPDKFLNNLPVDFLVFYPGEWELIRWTNRLRKLKTELATGELTIDGETPETIQTDITRFTTLLSDYRAWVKYEQSKPEDEKRLLRGITNF